MSTAHDRVREAFERLGQMLGFAHRPDQEQLALLLADLIQEGSTGSFEAPTGLGKSLAALIPALAHAAEGKRTVISTYTNVLAEQYWQRDLLLALEVMNAGKDSHLDATWRIGSSLVRTQFLIGRQRYACLAAFEEKWPDLAAEFEEVPGLGTESEFRDAIPRRGRELTQIWKDIATPPVCAARACHRFNDCFYYRARRSAERAELVITNHSIVIQDALLKQAQPGSAGLLGDFDFLIVDEAHDLLQAAQGGLEIELSDRTLNIAGAIAHRLDEALRPIARSAGHDEQWSRRMARLQEGIDQARRDLTGFSLVMGRSGILGVSPPELNTHPGVLQRLAEPADQRAAHEMATDLCDVLEEFTGETRALIEEWGESGDLNEGSDAWQNYLAYLEGASHQYRDLLAPAGVSVTFAETGLDAKLRLDVIDLAAPLKELLWDRGGWACLSATLALDGSFDHFNGATGSEPKFAEILPSPFSFAKQASLYLPPVDAIPDPALARKQGTESAYFDAIARELSAILLATDGRTLALFHSRRELDEVLARMNVPESLPILVQGRSGAASVGDRFRKSVRSSLFALRSFWTGFDAPGETLSCVVLVRVPFEVPVDPTAVARMAWLETRGENAFFAHSLPAAKLMMRQGAGRLIRHAEDRGIIALLDPRLRTKRYGEAILANLPSDMRMFEDIVEAAAWIGLEGWTPSPSDERSPVAVH